MKGKEKMETEKKRGGLKGLADNKTRDIYMLDPRLIKEKEGWNVRQGYGSDNKKFNELKESIRESGLKIPLRIYLENGTPFVSDGHHRLKAITELIAENEDFPRIPCISEPQNYSEEQRIFDLIICNDGQPLSMLESGIAFSRLIDRGYTQAEIAKKIGKSQGHVSNCVQLATAPKKIQEAIKAGEIKPNVALDVVRNCEDEVKAIEVVAQAIQTAKDNGGTKATGKDVKNTMANDPPAVNRKVNIASSVKSYRELIEINEIVWKEFKGYKVAKGVVDLLDGKITQTEFEALVKA
jgi:ParB/RepB/Spo0J family partition protein